MLLFVVLYFYYFLLTLLHCRQNIKSKIFSFSSDFIKIYFVLILLYYLPDYELDFEEFEQFSMRFLGYL